MSVFDMYWYLILILLLYTVKLYVDTYRHAGQI